MRRASAGAGTKRGARLGAWLYISKLVHFYIQKCWTDFIQFLMFFFNFRFLWKKKIRFSYSQTQIQIFFYKLKPEGSLHMCVKFYFSHVCRAHKNFQLFIKLLLKISFFAKFLFSLVHSKLVIIFYHLRNFHSIITSRILLMHF